ncbi:hypothetical protein Tco_1490153, partial [Tanacetum coccineum]
MKRSHFQGAEMTKMERVKESSLDGEIRITLVENLQSYQETKTKALLLEDLRVIAMRKKKKRPNTKCVSWLKNLM